MFSPNDDTQNDDGTGDTQNVSLHQAAENDDRTKVSNLLDDGVDINGRDESLQTALHCAIRNDSSAMVQLLLSRGADTSLRDNGTWDEQYGFTPIESAARLNATAAMQELIAHGVNIESSLAVFLAAKENHMDMLRLLFDKALRSMSDASRRRAIADALRASAKNRSLEMVRFVLQKLGDELAANTPDDHWQGVLNRALFAVFRYQDRNAGMPDYIRRSPWVHAVPVVDILVKAGASVDARDGEPFQQTALHYTLREQEIPLELITFLLDHGADVNLREWRGRSAFFELLGHPSTTEELIKMFTDAGAVVGPPDASGQTPLHCVRKTSIASWLVASGANIAVVDNQGEIPLHKASSMANLELVCFYLDAGSLIDTRNNSGWTPLLQSQSTSISKALLDHGANIHAATDQGITAIHHAARLCNAKLVSLLLANGADVHARVARDEHTDDGTTIIVEGNTPLHLATASSREQALEVVTALLDHGADIEAKESTGKTPLLLVISQKLYDLNHFADNENLVNYLLERGADPYAVDDSMKNAFQLAEDRNYRISETGNFERKPPPRNSHELNMGPGGRGRGAYGRGGFHP